MNQELRKNQNFENSSQNRTPTPITSTFCIATHFPRDTMVKPLKDFQDSDGIKIPQLGTTHLLREWPSPLGGATGAR